MHGISSSGEKRALYVNDCAKAASPSACVNSPPSDGWEVSGDSKLPLPEVSFQSGSLADTFDSHSSSSSNLAKLWNQPVTTLLLLVIFAVAYYLWAYRIDVSSVSYSYDAVVVRGEYWRIVTASMSHVDAWHLLFNTMSLYELGALESIYGSLTYAYLSVALIFITMLICIGIDYVLIYRYQRHEQQYSQAIGYSCVLFAWMVAISVRMPEFCPIFIFPSLCVPTWTLPFPSFVQQWTGMIGLAINLGPFLLLFFTKLIIPQSSFMGHLAGILIGYPVAWNLLNFLTLPWTFALLALLWMVMKKQWVWTFPSAEIPFTNLTEFVPWSTLYVYASLILVSLGLIVGNLWLLVYTSWIEQAVSRIVVSWFVFSAIWAVKIDFHTFSATVQSESGRFVWYTWLLLLIQWVCDLWTGVILTTDGGAAMILGGGVSLSHWRTVQVLTWTLVSLETLWLLVMWWLMQEMTSLQSWLRSLRMDRGSMLQDSKPLYDRCCASATVAFSGRSFRAAAAAAAVVAGAGTGTGDGLNASSSLPSNGGTTATAVVDDGDDVENPLIRGSGSGSGNGHGGGGIAMKTLRGGGANSPTGQAAGSGRGYDRLPQSSDHGHRQSPRQVSL